MATGRERKRLPSGWLVPWHAIPVENQASLQAELRRELPEGHKLYGREAKFIGRRQDLDDFLVALETGEVAYVHLTWSVETDPRWPASQIFKSLADWKRREMIPDHDDWKA